MKFSDFEKMYDSMSEHERKIFCCMIFTAVSLMTSCAEYMTERIKRESLGS